MTSAFISELIRAANEVGRLTKPERAGLLQRAAATIRDYRDQINYSDTPANDRGGPDDIVYCLNEMARLIESFSTQEVAETLMEAVEVIKAAKAAKLLLDAKRAIEYESLISEMNDAARPKR